METIEAQNLKNLMSKQIRSGYMTDFNKPVEAAKYALMEKVGFRAYNEICKQIVAEIKNGK